MGRSTNMERCEHCPGKTNCVPPEIGECNDYTIVFVGEAPGREEDKARRPFVGKTGREYTEHYLPLAGLRRVNTITTNAIKCLPVANQGRLSMDRPKDIELLQCCASTHLYGELQDYRPDLIVPMGAFACYAIDPSINLELQHGIPVETSWGTAFPMFHPASGIHEPKRMLMLRNDWIRLGRYLKGRLNIPKDPYPKPDYAEANPDHVLHDYLEMPSDSDWIMGCDTEIDRHRRPFCLTYSTLPGSGRLIRADNKDCLELFQGIIEEWRGYFLWHNWMFDSQVVQGMRLHFPKDKIIDTMVVAYHLGNLPQGLKALAYRELGMQMQDFDDLVTPYSQPKCLEYLEQVAQLDWPKPQEELVRDDEGQWKLYKPQSVATKIKRFFTDYGKNPHLDIFERWNKWESSHSMIEDKLGPWPGKDIRHVPFERVIHYACRDADALVRLWPILKHMRRSVRRKPQDQWGLQENHLTRRQVAGRV